MTKEKKEFISYVFLLGVALLIGLYGLYRSGHRIYLLSICSAEGHASITNQPTRKDYLERNVEYAFSFNGQQFNVSRMVPFGVSARQGEVVGIYFDPLDPENSYISGEMISGFIVDLFVILLGGGLFWLIRWIKSP